MSSELSVVSDAATSATTNVIDRSELLEQLQAQLKIQQEELLQHQRELLLQEGIQLSTPEISQQLQSLLLLLLAWGFTHGLIVGQLSVLFVIIVFVKFFVFADSTSINTKTSIIRDASGVIVKRDAKKGSGQSDSKTGQGDESLNEIRSKVTTILEKTYYDVDNHSPESLDWFNVLVAQTISQLRSEALLSDNIYHSLNDFLEKTKMPDFIDKINLTEIDIGDDFPIFSNCRIKQSKEGSGRLEAKIDVDLSDTLTLAIDTKLLLNHPRPLTAILPVELTVSIVRFSGCLTVSLINTNDQEFVDLKRYELSGRSTPESEDRDLPSSSTSSRSMSRTSSSAAAAQGANSEDPTSSKKSSKQDNSKEGAGTALMFSFSPDYRLEFVVKSLIGSRAKLQDVPKISALIESKLRTWFIERCVEPRFQVVRLPSLWPRSKNTREPVKTKLETSDDFSSAH